MVKEPVINYGRGEGYKTVEGGGGGSQVLPLPKGGRELWAEISLAMLKGGGHK